VGFAVCGERAEPVRPSRNPVSGFEGEGKMTEFVLAEGKWRRIFYSRAELLRFLALCTVSRECRASVKEVES